VSFLVRAWEVDAAASQALRRLRSKARVSHRRGRVSPVRGGELPFLGLLQGGDHSAPR